MENAITVIIFHNFSETAAKLLTFTTRLKVYAKRINGGREGLSLPEFPEGKFKTKMTIVSYDWS